MDSKLMSLRRFNPISNVVCKRGLTLEPANGSYCPGTPHSPHSATEVTAVRGPGSRNWESLSTARKKNE